MYNYKQTLPHFFVVTILFVLFFTSVAYALPPKGFEQNKLELLEQHILSGGPQKDGIPPIENPIYTTVALANKTLQDNDVVFLIETPSEAYVYPQRILVFHEIVNETFSGQSVSLTYCPLVGSAIGFKGQAGYKQKTFGTSGKLVNSNLIMYDRATDSYWPQILGTAINGPMKGKTLEQIPVLWTTWGKVKKVYPKAHVLSEKTGHRRPYGHDPYGSYTKGEGYYNTPELAFPVLNKSNRLSSKTMVTGIKSDGKTLAVSKERIRKEKIAPLKLGKTDLIAVYDPALDVVRVFSRTVNHQPLSFTFKNGQLTDNETETTWSIRGQGLTGKLKGKHLKPATFFDVMWFAWVAFYPETALYH